MEIHEVQVKDIKRKILRIASDIKSGNLHSGMFGLGMLYAFFKMKKKIDIKYFN